jgi:hypothetical protein
MRTGQLFDKALWIQGPWTTEPDYVAWIDEDTHYRCIARRNALGAWCGFVGVVGDHPLFMLPRTDTAFQFVDIHGGVTVAEFCDEPDPLFVPPVRAWWIGFDCMHDCDVLPQFVNAADAPKLLPREELEDNEDRFDAKTGHPLYRDMDYVKNEVGFLAMQLEYFAENDKYV